MSRLIVNMGKIVQEKMREQNISISDLAQLLNLNENDLRKLFVGDLYVPPSYYENICTVLNTSFSEVIRAAVKTP